MTQNFPDQPDEAVPEESEQLNQLQGEEWLGDRDVSDPLDEGYIAPDDWSAAQGFGNTAEEQAEGETLDQRIKQEVPDEGAEEFDPAATTDELDDLAAEHLDDGEVGDARAGRLVDPGMADNTSDPEDEVSELIGEDVGIDSGAASAEEAAVHVVEEPRLED